jgi:hypothetical protein
VGCRGLFIDKLRTSRRGASIVCDRERRREVGTNAPWPDAIQAGPRMLPASLFRSRSAANRDFQAPASRTAPQPQKHHAKRANSPVARATQPRTTQMKHTPRWQKRRLIAPDCT